MHNPYTHLAGLLDELEKIAARIPFVHGTSGRWTTLVPGIGRAIAPNDPNVRAVYVATAKRSTFSNVKHFAKNAVKARGGEPVIAMGKIDTRKGWVPASLTEKARKAGVGLDDVRDTIDAIEKTPSRSERGKLYRAVHDYVGAWRNKDPSTVIRPTKYKKAAAFL